MRVSRVVLDTNVLISYALTPNGIAGKIAAYFIEHGLLIFSKETFSEFESRIWRAKFDKYVSIEQRKLILHDLEMIGEWVEITGSYTCSCDPDDDKFVETSIVRKVDYLISGDSDLLELEVEGVLILTPRNCLELLVASK